MQVDRLGFEENAAVVVTGAASGIGRATAIAAARCGLRVGIWDIQRASAEETEAEITALTKQRCFVATIDVTDRSQVEQAFHLTRESLGPLRYLVNNAGPRAADPREFVDGLRMGAGSMQLVTECWLGTRPSGACAAVNVASVAGNIVGADPVWYATTKAAIGGYTRAMALQLGPTTRMNAVAPSLVDTPRMGKWTESEQGRNWAETNPLKRWAVADDIAWPILFLLSPMAGYINGVVLPIDGGQTLVL